MQYLVTILSVVDWSATAFKFHILKDGSTFVCVLRKTQGTVNNHTCARVGIYEINYATNCKYTTKMKANPTVIKSSLVNLY